MRLPAALAVLVAATALTACAPSTTERQINEALEAQLRSAQGPWTGTSAKVALSFQVTEAADGHLSGTGTMRELDVAGAVDVPITVTGSYVRPTLVLGFTGMRRNGQSVRGDVSGQYTSVGGVASTLVLTGVGGSTYSEQVPILLQEASP